MKGLNHDFYLLSCKQYSIADYTQFPKTPGTVRIHHDLMEYCSDTFAWIPCHNPSTHQPHQGFCYYGVTVIDVRGADVARRIFRHWAKLFAVAPDIVCLTGHWTHFFVNEDGIESGEEYQKLVYVRQELLQKFEQLEVFAHQVLLDKGESFIAHKGI